MIELENFRESEFHMLGGGEGNFYCWYTNDQFARIWIYCSDVQCIVGEKYKHLEVFYAGDGGERNFR